MISKLLYKLIETIHDIPNLGKAIKHDWNYNSVYSLIKDYLEERKLKNFDKFLAKKGYRKDLPIHVKEWLWYHYLNDTNAIFVRNLEQLHNIENNGSVAEW